MVRFIMFIIIIAGYYAIYRLTYYLLRKHGKKYDLVTIKHASDMPWDSVDETYMGYSVAWVITIPLILLSFIFKKQ